MNWTGVRDYDPQTGRWTATLKYKFLYDFKKSQKLKDPIGFAGGLTSLYDYVGGDPVNYVDETGAEKKKPNMRENPNKRKGSENRQKKGERERNKGHQDGEEHSRKKKGGPKIFLRLPFFCDILCQLQMRELERLEELESLGEIIKLETDDDVFFKTCY